jgi:hypothetical protein
LRPFDPAQLLQRLLESHDRAIDTLVAREDHVTEQHMNGLIYLIGLIVMILFVLSFFGLR